MLAELRESLRRADPTTKTSYRLMTLLFSILQWMAFAATIQAIGIKVHEPLLRVIGYLLYLIVVGYSAEITWILIGAASKAHRFESQAAVVTARIVSIAISLGVTVYLISTFRSAASKLILFYAN